jgi:hypothetical protein
VRDGRRLHIDRSILGSGRSGTACFLASEFPDFCRALASADTLDAVAGWAIIMAVGVSNGTSRAMSDSSCQPYVEVMTWS